MSYEAVEESQQDGLVASLFLIEYGDAATSFFAYTDADEPVTFDGVTYLPTTIGREKIEANGNLDKSTLTIDITPNASIVQLFRGRLPSSRVTMTIFQGHVGDGDFKAVWVGRVISVTRKTRFAQIAGEPVSTVMKRAGLRRHYQYGCPWALYGSECKANKARATRSVPTTAVGDNFVEFNDGWQGTFGKAKFVGGYLQWVDNETGIRQTRTILTFGENENQLVVNGDIFGIETGDQAEVVLGCNHQFSDCENLHLNIVNFGGQPWIPKDNPTTLTNQFY